LGKLRDNKRDLSRHSGTKRRTEEKKRILPGSLAVQNTERVRRNFNLIREAQRKEKEKLEMPAVKRSIELKIKGLVKEVTSKPVNKWTAKNMQDLEQYFTPNQVRQMMDIANKKR